MRCIHFSLKLYAVCMKGANDSDDDATDGEDDAGITMKRTSDWYGLQGQP